MPFFVKDKIGGRTSKPPLSNWSSLKMEVQWLRLCTFDDSLGGNPARSEERKDVKIGHGAEWVGDGSRRYPVTPGQLFIPDH